MLSVVVTAYGRPDGLDATLASLAAQSRLPDELIVADDHSPVDPLAVVERWRGKFPSLRYVRQACNLGMPGNLNAAIALAQGEFIANLHDGDTFSPTLLERWERLLQRFPTAGFVFCGATPPAVSACALSDLPEFLPGREAYQRLFRNSWRGSSPVWGTVMARRGAYARHLPFDPAYAALADVDMWMRLCMAHDVAVLRENAIHLEAPSHFTRSVRWDLVDALRRIHEVNLERSARLGWSGAWHRFCHHWIFQVFFLIQLQSVLRKGEPASWSAARRAAGPFGLPVSLLALGAPER